MPRAARIALWVILAVPFFWGLGSEEFHGDESHWVSGGRRAWWLVTTGRWGSEEWREEFYFYSQPQVGKLLIGAAQAVAGISGEAPVVDYDWQRLPPENVAAGRVPAPSAVLAGRVPGAVLGWAGCLVVWGLAAAMGAPRAGPLAAVLLASQPLWLANARRAGLDVPALTMGLAAALAGLTAVRRRRAGWWVAAGALAGLSVGTKYVGLLALGAAVPALAVELWGRRRWQEAAGAVLTACLAVAVFVGTNPSLWANPWSGLNVSLGFLSEQTEGMRHTIPEFRSPVWVAGQIVDRVFWPLGGPRVVERSMSEPLIPGTYGTPIVALGVMVALLLGMRARSAREAAVWSVMVFVALALSLPTWWERWHLPLVPPLVLLAGMGLERIPRERALAVAQYVSALALLPSYLGKGFGQLVMTPVGAVAHLAALAWALSTLVSLALLRRRTSGERENNGSAQEDD